MYTFMISWKSCSLETDFLVSNIEGKRLIKAYRYYSVQAVKIHALLIAFVRWATKIGGLIDRFSPPRCSRSSSRESLTKVEIIEHCLQCKMFPAEPCCVIYVFCIGCVIYVICIGCVIYEICIDLDSWVSRLRFISWINYNKCIGCVGRVSCIGWACCISWVSSA